MSKLKVISQGRNVVDRYACAKCGYLFPMNITDKDGNYNPAGRYWHKGTIYNYCPMCGDKVEGIEKKEKDALVIIWGILFAMSVLMM